MSNLVPAMQGIVSDIPMPSETRGARIKRERAEAEAAKQAAKAMKGQPVTKAKVSLAGADQTVTVVPTPQQKTIIDLPAMWRRIKKQWNKHRGLNITLSCFVLAIALVVSILSMNDAWDSKVQDQVHKQAQTHQADNKAATPITITENPTSIAPNAETKETTKVPGVPVTPSTDTTQAPSPTTQPEETIKQVPVDTYIIANGDSLWKIAEDLYGDGTRWKEIYEKNKDVINSQDSRNLQDAGHWIHAGITLNL